MTMNDCCLEAPRGVRNALEPIDTGVKGREIHIRPLNRGYVINVGCQTFAIEEKAKLVDLLTQYLENPQETEDLYFQGKLF